MARKVRTNFRKLPQDTHDALADTANLKNNAALKKLKERRVTIVTPISKIHKLAKAESKINDVPIVVSTKEFTNAAHAHNDPDFMQADGLATEFENGNCKITLHPIVQYYHEDTIRDIINHELDHVKVYRKRKGVQRPQYYGYSPSISNIL